MTHRQRDNLSCRLCGGALSEKFSRVILQKHSVQYFQCAGCHSLQTEEPYWLDEAYAEADFNIDTGALQRNLQLFVICFTVSKIFGVATALDFGAKDGILCRFLRDHEINCYAYDKYAKSNYVTDFTVPPTTGIDLVMAFEVMEHFAHPAQDFEEIFAFRPKYFLFSTSTYTDQGKDWGYLATEHGQHVFFYSVAAIYLVAKKYGYAAIEIGQGVGLFYQPNTPNISNMLVAAQTALNGWIFQAIRSYVLTMPANGVFKDHDTITSKLHNRLPLV